MLSTLKKERHMVTNLKTTEDLVHSLNIYISWSVMEIFFSSKNISQKHQANMSFLWKLLNLFLPDPQGLFWATLDFPESQGLLTFLSVQCVTNLFPCWRCPGGHKKRTGWYRQCRMIHIQWCFVGQEDIYQLKETDYSILLSQCQL